MRLTKTQKAILDHARRIGLVTVVGRRQEEAADKLMINGLLKHSGGNTATFQLTEAGTKYVSH